MESSREFNFNAAFLELSRNDPTRTNLIEHDVDVGDATPIKQHPYREVNAVTRTDSYPIPRIDDCIDRIGKATYVSKFDLLKGYWEIPLTERARKISAFVTPDGLFQYKVMPFEVVIIHHRLALSLFARGTSSYATARCRSTTVPSSKCMHYQPLDQTRQILSKGF
ncbi:hypothetical protein HOLleu_31507 [Holothuria leucospilota]|uniref:Reverse transcriptase domain-containing protein n=1 Tax=Holothuria leucospilota TaxID=206669 RepID=A0A9Q0YQI9_HOLLE|nr:hypothetical protein HOLleu_31507 [Holothuria leucospilota]